jgi:hypothetical protein
MKKIRDDGAGARTDAAGRPLARLGAARRRCWGRLTRFLERCLWRPPGERGQHGPRESDGGGQGNVRAWNMYVRMRAMNLTVH